MKNKLFIALLAAAGLSSVAAQAAEPYVGINAGRSEQKVDFGLGESDDTDTAYKLYGGYQFNQTFGLEAGFVRHGQVDLPLSGVVATTRARSTYLAATATLPLNEQFGLFTKLGISHNRTKYGFFGNTSDSISQNRAMVGIGASLKLAPTISAVVEFERFGRFTDNGAKLNADTLSAGLRKSF